MKYKVIIIISIFLLNCHNNKEHPQEIVLDIKTTADSLTLFGENLISTPLYERDMAISPMGNELIYTLGDYKQHKRCLVVVKQNDTTWIKPEILNISGKYQDIEPFYSNNGNRLYFASNRPIYGDSTRTDYNIWYSDRDNNGWSQPVALDSIVNSRSDEFFPSFSEKGNLFFTATRDDGIGREDIFMSELLHGKFQPPKPLPPEINSTFFEFNAYISPKEDLIIFSSYGRDDGYGGGDLYMSRKDDTGKWTTAKNLGALINSEKLDFCPFVDWDSRNFYFTSERIIDVDKKLQGVEELKEMSNSTLNGFGNIYRISIDKLE